MNLNQVDREKLSGRGTSSELPRDGTIVWIEGTGDNTRLEVENNDVTGQYDEYIAKTIIFGVDKEIVFEELNNHRLKPVGLFAD